VLTSKSKPKTTEFNQSFHHRGCRKNGSPVFVPVGTFIFRRDDSIRGRSLLMFRRFFAGARRGIAHDAPPTVNIFTPCKTILKINYLLTLK